MSERYKPYAAVLTFLVKDNSILLIRRFNTGWADGSYTVPSGHVDADESVTVAAAREAKEEIGVTILPKDLQFAHVMHRKNSESNREYVDFFFSANTWLGEPVNNEPNKCDDLKWFLLGELPDNIVPFVRDAITAYRNKIHFSESGW